MLHLVSYRSDRTAPDLACRRCLSSCTDRSRRVCSLQGGTATAQCGLSWRQARDEQEQILAWATRQLDEGEQVLSLDEVELGPPVPDPEKIVCLGLNYPEHAAEAGLDIPPVPTFFAKFRNSLVGPTSPVILPAADHFIDYEGELAVVIGKRCKHVSEQEALAYVAGYTVCNDVSARDAPDADQPVDGRQSH